MHFCSCSRLISWPWVSHLAFFFSLSPVFKWKSISFPILNFLMQLHSFIVFFYIYEHGGSWSYLHILNVDIWQRWFMKPFHSDRSENDLIKSDLYLINPPNHWIITNGLYIWTGEQKLHLNSMCVGCTE